MTTKIRCDKCRRIYVCSKRNTKIIGPVLETTCDHCRSFLMKNMSAFVFDQTNIGDFSPIYRANNMIALAQAIGKEVNDEKPFVHRKKKK